jgi:FkbM family methyltransferase
MWGSTNGQTKIFEPDHSFGPHSLDVSCFAIGDTGIEVEMRTVDVMLNSIKAPPLRLVKIDVEGFEPQVIGGMLQTLEQTGAQVIFEALTADALSESKALLTKLGYSVNQVDGNNFLAARSTVTT